MEVVRQALATGEPGKANQACLLRPKCGRSGGTHARKDKAGTRNIEVGLAVNNTISGSLLWQLRRRKPKFRLRLR